MSYEQQYTQGIENLTHIDPRFTLDQPGKELLETTFRSTSDKALQEPFFSIRQRICEQAAHYANDTSVESFNYQCLADSHTFLKACVEQSLAPKNYMTLTIGDVSFDGEKLFNTSSETIRSCLTNGISTADKPLFHVWLTLADMTVIDLTINSQLMGLQLLPQTKANDGLLNVWRTERRGRLDYHPLLIDDAFLSRLKQPSH